MLTKRPHNVKNAYRTDGGVYVMRLFRKHPLLPGLPRQTCITGIILLLLSLQALAQRTVLQIQGMYATLFYNMRKAYTRLLLLTASVFVVSCQCQQKIRPDILDPADRPIEAGKECPPASLAQSMSDDAFKFLSSDWSYQPKEIEVSGGEAMLDAYPNLGAYYFEHFSNLGGPKLIGEMSADKAGYSFSTGPVTVKVLPLSEMHLQWVNDRFNIFTQVIEGHITLFDVDITDSYWDFTCDFQMCNNTNERLFVEIPAGQMLEVVGDGVQNVVVSKGKTIHLPPNEIVTASVPILCAAHHRSNPKGYPARVTPFILDIPSQDIRSQNGVWNRIESAEVTFYAWRSGDRTQSGTSTYGHAFVRLPGAGVYGFGARHRGKRLLLGEPGEIFEHSHLVRYATDSCRVKVTDKQLKAMIDKLEYLQLHVPEYELGRYDCTSFTMDIADAGGIRYGTRSLIQWPISFIEEMKAHNTERSYSYGMW